MAEEFDHKTEGEIHAPAPPRGIDEHEAPAASGRNTAAPSGMPLELHPAPAGAVRVKKSIGMAVAIAGFVLVMVIAYAIATHKGMQPKYKTKSESMESGEKNGAAVISKLAETGDQQQDGTKSDVGDELNIPPPLKVVPRGGGGNNNVYGSDGNGANRPQGSGGDSGGQRPLTPSQVAVEEEFKAERAAMTAPMGARQGGGSGSSFGGGSGASGSNPLGTLGETLERAIAGGGLPGGAGASAAAGSKAGGMGQDDQNGQEEKESFAERAKAHPDFGYLKETRTDALSLFEVKAGWDIPATLEQEINSDLPGDVRGLVRENVYDTATGRYLLIPQGSRVIGTYNHRVAYGQTGVQVVWTRLIYPDGSSINLEGMAGEDARGQSGFRDKVDNHYTRLIGFALMTSVFAAGIELTQNQSQTSSYLTPSQALTQSMGQQLGELGMGIAQKNLNIQPTINIRIGYRFNIRVDRDIAFSAPYSPVQGP